MISTKQLFPSSAKIKLKLINEPCLVDGDWLEIAFQQKTSEEEFSSIYRQAALQAGQAKLNKIELLLPAGIKLSETLLKKYGFRKGLAEFTFDFKKNTIPTAKKTTNFTLSHQAQPLEKLLPLLKEQATFHHLAEPAYYLSVQKLHWPAYQQQVMEDQTKKNSLTMHLIHQDELIGLIIGEKEKDKALIWEIVIAKNHRAHGWGSLLITNYLTWLKKQNIKTAMLETLPNTPAYGWYQKLGWQQTQQSWYKQLN